ncbi:MAG: amidohydrolase [Clostridiaceae bacterium]|nr:amidohydrolase [Clostridiaceae bacterium]
MLIKNANILTMDNGKCYKKGFIKIINGKIAQVGEMQNAPTDDDNLIDAEGGFALPGFVDAHCHLGLFGDSIGFEGSDGNEETTPLTPHLRAIDGIDTFDRCFEEARNSGVTTAVVSPGSSNVIGGQIAAIKTFGCCVDDMIIKAPCGIKCAFGENPKYTHSEKKQMPTTRMSTAALLREALYNAKMQQKDTEEKVDFQTQPILGLLNRELPLHAHAHRADDILTAMRIGKEFDILVKIVHGTQGDKIADKLAEENIDVIIGPIINSRNKPELSGASMKTAAILQNAGVRVALTTDHPEVPINFLLLSAQLAVKNGMSAEGALRAITCDAASVAGIDNYVGKIKNGLHADILIFDKPPLDFNSNLILKIISGQLIA